MHKQGHRLPIGDDAPTRARRVPRVLQRGRGSAHNSDARVPPGWDTAHRPCPTRAAHWGRRGAGAKAIAGCTCLGHGPRAMSQAERVRPGFLIQTRSLYCRQRHRDRCPQRTWVIAQTPRDSAVLRNTDSGTGLHPPTAYLSTQGSTAGAPLRGDTEQGRKGSVPCPLTRSCQGPLSGPVSMSRQGFRPARSTT